MRPAQFVWFDCGVSAICAARGWLQAALQLEPDLREARLNLEKALVELAAEQRAGTVAAPNRQP
jgi:hypothetical protein